MPRPKRQKVVPSAPAITTRALDESTIVVELPGLPTEQKRAYVGMTSSLSDDEDAAPVVKRGRGRPPKRRPQAERSLPADDATESENAAGEDLAGDSLLGDIELGSSSPSVEMGRRDRSSTTFENSFLSVTNFRRRPRQPSILGRVQAQPRDSSADSSRRAVSDNMATMSSRNASTLSIGNFKRRPRQPSVLGRARSSSLGFDTDHGTPAQPASALRLGNFRRRARESSVLGTGRKPQHGQAAADDEDEEDDFNPEDESTPLNKAKTAPAGTPSALSSSNSRKRKLSAAKPSQSSTAAATPDGAEELAAPASDDTPDEYDIPSSPPESPIRSIEVAVEPMNETMAPPQSSPSPPDSPVDSSPPLPAIHSIQPLEYHSRGRRPYRGRTPPPATQDSPISSPPPLTHSPNRRGRASPAAKARGRRPAPPPSAFSTAQLQTLLPRRRRQVNRDPYEIESSDDDELINLRVAPRSRRPATSFIRRPAPLKKPGRPPNGSRSGPEGARGKATYGSRAAATSDKENEEYDPDHSLAPLPDDEDGDAGREKARNVTPTRELKEAVKKFQDVDQWELEFEEVTASSSSPLGAR